MVSVADNRAAVAYARFGLGRRAGGPEHGDDAYIRLLQEIDDGGVPQPGNGDLPSGADIFTRIWAAKTAFKQGQTGPGNNPGPDLFNDELDARYNGTFLEADTGLTERLVMFWANHFAVSRDKHSEINAAAGAFEREAIRPFVYGRFFDMLLAVETHPAMIWFLDNQNSAGPNSRRGKDLGLNENLAREIMELHTLGVRTGYDQSDVTAFARVLTGWTVRYKDAEPGPQLGGFGFNPRMHEPGAQTIMGRSYEEEGFMQGAHVLRDLASRPATAHHIALKLARHFISDTPPPALVTRLQQAFLDTQGDLKAVTRTLVQSDEALATPGQKLRLPQEYLAVAQRALDVRVKPELLQKWLTGMGQPMWLPGGPDGFNDTVPVWATPVSLAGRVGMATDIARLTESPPDPRQFASESLGALLTGATRDVVARAETRQQGLALAMLSPEFMRR